MGTDGKIAGISKWAWGIFGAGLLCVPLAYLLLSRNDAARPPVEAAYVHEATQKGTTAVQHDIADVKRDTTTMRNVERDILHDIGKQNVKIDGLQAKAEQHELELRQMAALEAFHARLNEDRMAQVQYATALTAINTMPKGAQNSQSRSFSYFEGGGWELEMDQMERSAGLVGAMHLVSKGTDGKDFIRFPNERDVLLDGFSYRKIEGYDFTNGHPNGITVLAPGLISLKNDTMQIDGDAALDNVTLDGCLKWEQAKKDGKYVYWKALDVENASRTVMIGAGIPVTVDSSCDNRYLLRRQQSNATKLWEDPTRSRHELDIKELQDSDAIAVKINQP